MLCAIVGRPLAAADSADATVQKKSQVALAEYYECVKGYALKFAKTTAPASEVAEAALSACSDSYQTLFSANLAFVGSMETAQRLGSLANDAARRWAIKSLLEARFPIK